jgi:dTDP-4-dehydrorhamnose reductase/predicted rRNA methylase YqxC with S4 and FtsJ domains
MSKSITENSVIFGGNGMIGTHIDFGYKPSSTEVNILDINMIENYMKKLPNVTCIINMVALNLRDSDKYPHKSINVNINGTINLLEIAKKLNIPFILLSTGAVFSSNNPCNIFTENTKTNPNCTYGYTKDCSEKVAMLYDKTIIIRTGWVFGGSQKHHYKFVETFINNIITNTDIYASNNLYGSPTYVIDLVKHMRYLINNEKYGIHHVVNSGAASGYDVCMEIANLLGKNTNIIHSVNYENVPNSIPIRSNSEILESIYDFNKLRTWKTALHEYLNIYLKNKMLNNEIIENKDETNFWINREKCRLCNSTQLQIFFKLEPTPQANHFVKTPISQKVIPLDICICNNCKHIQLIQIVNESFQFSKYLYITSASQTMVNHVTTQIDFFLKNFNIDKNDNILEIGANDGTGIRFLIENGYHNSIGIDPAKNINDIHNLPIVCDFFGSNILNNEKFKKNMFKLIYAFHCCAHIENIQDIFYTIYNLLDNDGIFIMEVGYFYEVYKNHLFDTIYHEHIDYHTCKVMQQFCYKNNLKLFDVRTNKIQSGSIQFFISKNMNIDINENVYNLIQQEEKIQLFDIHNLLNWKEKIIFNSRDLNCIINSFINENKIIFGYGASAKSTTFIHQFKLSKNVIKYIIDDSYLKQNLFTPGTNIPIVPIDILNYEKCDYLLILSWNFLDDILLKIDKYRKCGLRVIVPFPNISII